MRRTFDVTALIVIVTLGTLAIFSVGYITGYRDAPVPSWCGGRR
jgi:hypothetical protein